MLQFKIEQIALCPANPEMAQEMLRDLGMTDWFKDYVRARGEVHGRKDIVNEAELLFNYESQGNNPFLLELEILHYTVGDNWVSDNLPCVSHLGMHVTEDELAEFRSYFEKKWINVAQEVFTESHTNPEIKDKRRYHYCIFETRHILGVDLKFIVRKDIEPKVNVSSGEDHHI